MTDQGDRASFGVDTPSDKGQKAENNGPSNETGVTKGRTQALSLEKGRMTVRAFIRKAQIAASDHVQRRQKVDWSQRIFNESWAITDTDGERYLFSRGIEFAEQPPPEALRFHPSVLHEPTHKHYPALIAAVTNADGCLVGIHRTYLQPGGKSKADIPFGGTKRMLGDCYGSFVRLSTNVEKKLVITESIETALTIMQACPEMPVWAAMSLGNMKAPVPSHVQEIILCADGDNRDPNAAERLLMDAVRLQQEANHRVLIARPPQGLDFNDLLLTE